MNFKLPFKILFSNIFVSISGGILNISAQKIPASKLDEIKNALWTRSLVKKIRLKIVVVVSAVV